MEVAASRFLQDVSINSWKIDIYSFR